MRVLCISKLRSRIIGVVHYPSVILRVWRPCQRILQNKDSKSFSTQDCLHSIRVTIVVYPNSLYLSLRKTLHLMITRSREFSVLLEIEAPRTKWSQNSSQGSPNKKNRNLPKSWEALTRAISTSTCLVLKPSLTRLWNLATSCIASPSTHTRTRFIFLRLQSRHLCKDRRYW